jgi:hypothetical protein
MKIQTVDIFSKCVLKCVSDSNSAAVADRFYCAVRSSCSICVESSAGGRPALYLSV